MVYTPICCPCRSNLLKSNHVSISPVKVWCSPPTFCPCRSNLLESNYVPISAAKVTLVQAVSIPLSSLRLHGISLRAVSNGKTKTSVHISPVRRTCFMQHTLKANETSLSSYPRPLKESIKWSLDDDSHMRTLQMRSN